MQQEEEEEEELESPSFGAGMPLFLRGEERGGVVFAFLFFLELDAMAVFLFILDTATSTALTFPKVPTFIIWRATRARDDEREFGGLPFSLDAVAFFPVVFIFLLC